MVFPTGKRRFLKRHCRSPKGGLTFIGLGLLFVVPGLINILEITLIRSAYS